VDILVEDGGVVTAYPPAAVESEITAQVPDRTGAVDAYKTISVSVARAGTGYRSAHAAKLAASRNVARKWF
jgi:hypothetical protein